MKKIIVVILIILPFFFMIMIGLMGRIVGEYELVSVESITLNYDFDGSTYEDIEGKTSVVTVLSTEELAYIEYTINPSDYTVSDIRVSCSNEDALTVTLTNNGKIKLQAGETATEEDILVTIYCNASDAYTSFYVQIVDKKN